MLPRSAGLSSGIVIGILLVILVSGVLNSTLGPNITYRASLSYSNGVVTERISGDSRYAAQLARADYLIGGAPAAWTFYFYFDSSYPTSYSSEQYWFGLSQLLAQLAVERSWPIHLQLVNAVQLGALLRGPASPDSILIMASGVLPATVFGPSDNEVVSWLRTGGTVIWVGDTIGAYYGEPSSGGGPPLLEPMGPGGIAQFLNLTYLGYGGTYYPTPSQYSTAFNFGYDLGLGNGFEFDAHKVDAAGGMALGPQAGNITSLAKLPEGAGRLVDFAGPLSDLNVLAQTIMNGVQSGVFLSKTELLGSSSISIDAGSIFATGASYDVPSGVVSNGLSSFCSFAFEPGTFAQFAQLNCIGLQ